MINRIVTFDQRNWSFLHFCVFFLSNGAMSWCASYNWFNCYWDLLLLDECHWLTNNQLFRFIVYGAAFFQKHFHKMNLLTLHILQSSPSHFSHRLISILITPSGECKVHYNIVCVEKSQSAVTNVRELQGAQEAPRAGINESTFHTWSDQNIFTPNQSPPKTSAQG